MHAINHKPYLLTLKEPEESTESQGAPMVPGLTPPSPRPMVHDPLDRQENDVPALTAAELARFDCYSLTHPIKLHSIFKAMLGSSGAAVLRHCVLSVLAQHAATGCELDFT